MLVADGYPLPMRIPPTHARSTLLAVLMVFAANTLGCGGAAQPEAAEPSGELEAATVTPSSALETPAHSPPHENSGPRPSLETPPDVARPPADAERSPSGVASRVLWYGSGGARPRAQDIVIVHYSAWTTDGNRFDSSVERGESYTFALPSVIPGWAEGLRGMTVGEQRSIWIPEAQAYGGAPGRPEGMLVYDVELIGIEASPPVVPVDVAVIPADAEVTPSGLASRVLQTGTGTEHPTPTSTVSVHYSGWTTDGQMFDSSVARGRVVSFPLDRVIEGWTEGVQLMVTGEKRRFWIPVNLAYAGRAGMPAGMLVFDVTLIAIQ